MIRRAFPCDERDRAVAICELADLETFSLDGRTCKLPVVVDREAVEIRAHEAGDRVEIVEDETNATVYENVDERLELVCNADGVTGVTEQVPGHVVPRSLWQNNIRTT